MTSRRFGGLVAVGAVPLVAFTVALIASGPTGGSRYWLDAARSCCGWLYTGWMGFLLQARFRHLPRGQEFALKLFRLGERIRREGIRSADWTEEEARAMLDPERGLQLEVLTLWEEAAFLGLEFPTGCVPKVLGNIMFAGGQGSGAAGDRKRMRLAMCEAADVLETACDWVRR